MIWTGESGRAPSAVLRNVGYRPDTLDLVDPKPVEEERHVPFVARKVHPHITVGRILRKRHLIVERDLMPLLANIFKEVLDNPEEAKDLDAGRDLLVHLPDERIPRRLV